MASYLESLAVGAVDDEEEWLAGERDNISRVEAVRGGDGVRDIGCLFYGLAEGGGATAAVACE